MSFLAVMDPKFPSNIRLVAPTLTTLTILFPQDLWIGASYHDIEALPKSLTSLTLRFAEAGLIFAQSGLKHRGDRAPDVLPFAYASRPGSGLNVRKFEKYLLPLPALLPNLCLLDIQCRYGGFCGVLLNYLPPSITSFSLYGKLYSDELMELEATTLLPFLRTLLLPLADLSGNLAELFPALNNVELGPSPSSFAIFPPTIEELRFFVPKHSTTDPQTLASLSLKKLDFFTTPGDPLPYLQALPSTLTHLSIGASSTVNQQHLALLPASLTFLSCCASPSSWDLFALLPRGLTCLRMIGDIPDDPYGDTEYHKLSNLPPKLTELYLTAFTISTRMLPLLPRSLTILEPRFFLFLSFQDMPPRLQSLTLENLEPAFIPVLPATLTYLRIWDLDPFTDDNIGLLPATMKDLTLNQNISLTNAAIALLPRNLHSLDLSRNTNISDDGLKRLPPMLKILTIKGATDISEKVVPFLPRNLASIEIRNVDSWGDDSAKYLPPFLNQLILGKGTRFTNAGCHDLPPKLVTLELRLNRALTFECLRLLPRTLQTLSLPKNINFTKANQHLLPPTLCIVTSKLKRVPDL